MKNTKEEALANIKEMEARIKETKDYIQSLDKQSEAETWFVDEILKDLRVGMIERGYVDYRNREGRRVICDQKNGEFWFSYARVWSILETKFGMKHSEIQTFLTNMLLTHLNWEATITSIFTEIKEHQLLTPQLEGYNKNI